MNPALSVSPARPSRWQPRTTDYPPEKLVADEPLFQNLENNPLFCAVTAERHATFFDRRRTRSQSHDESLSSALRWAFIVLLIYAGGIFGYLALRLTRYASLTSLQFERHLERELGLPLKYWREARRARVTLDDLAAAIWASGLSRTNLLRRKLGLAAGVIVLAAVFLVILDERLLGPAFNRPVGRIVPNVFLCILAYKAWMLRWVRFEALTQLQVKTKSLRDELANKGDVFSIGVSAFGRGMAAYILIVFVSAPIILFLAFGEALIEGGEFPWMPAIEISVALLFGLIGANWRGSEIATQRDTLLRGIRSNLKVLDLFVLQSEPK